MAWRAASAPLESWAPRSETHLACTPGKIPSCLLLQYTLTFTSVPIGIDMTRHCWAGTLCVPVARASYGMAYAGGAGAGAHMLFSYGYGGVHRCRVAWCGFWRTPYGRLNGADARPSKRRVVAARAIVLVGGGGGETDDPRKASGGHDTRVLKMLYAEEGIRRGCEPRKEY